MTDKEKAESIKALNCLIEDFEMLKDGRWSVTEDSDACDASLDNVRLVLKNLK